MSKIIKKTSCGVSDLYDISMPNIHNFVANNIVVHNCDFSEPERAREYLIEKYGNDRVIRIGTFQTLQTAGSIKDIMKSTHPEIDFMAVNKITSSMGKRDLEETEVEFFERNLEENDLVKTFFSKYPEVQRKVEKLIGYNRQSGVHPCFSGDSTILTEDGFETFEKLNGKSKKILTPDGWKKAIFFLNGKKEIATFKVRSSCRSNSYLISKNTVDHTFLSKDSSFNNLDENFIPSSILGNDFDILFILLGWLWNDGTYLKDKKQFYLYRTPIKDEEILNLIPDTDILPIPGRKDRFLLSKDLSEKIFSLGYCANKVKDKNFPVNWEHWNMKQKLSWLRGMFSANGYVIRNNVVLKLTSHSLIRPIYDFMKSCGYVSGPYLVSKDSDIGWKSRSTGTFYLSYSGRMLFVKTIGFLQKYKNDNVVLDTSYIRKGKNVIIDNVYDFTVVDGKCPVGLVNGLWAHNCGLAITQDPIFNFAPLRKIKGKSVLEFNAPSCEQSGIIKYDILSLNTLNYIQRTCELVGIKDPYDIPLDDKETHLAFQLGETNAVFQFNSDVAKNILTKLPLEEMSLDVESMTTSVGRPGPMGNGQHIEFYRRVRRERPSVAPHYALEQELKDTYGIMIYQENVMKASQILGGFSLAEADDIRKAMGKKKASILVPYKERFITHCEQAFPETKDKYKDEDGNYHPYSRAEHIWNLMATFSGYGFCKAHSMSYTLIGYICQYLKTHHTLSWWTACLMFAGDDKLSTYYEDAKYYCIDPEINNSLDTYTIVNNKIQMPLSAIKGLGPKAVEEIYNLRPFASIEDFFARINKTRINKAVVSRLIFSGCFNFLCPDKTKQQLIEYYYAEIRKEKLPPELTNLSEQFLLNERIKALSYLERDLYQIYAMYTNEEVVHYSNVVMSKLPITVLGKITKVKKKKTAKGNEYADLEIENLGEKLRIKVWSDELDCYRETLTEKAELSFKCKTSMYNEKVQLTLISCKKIGD